MNRALYSDWTLLEMEQAVRLKTSSTNYTRRQVADRIGRSIIEVKNFFRWLSQENYEKPKSKNGPSLRPCMCCKKTFRSEGIHNRLCYTCNQQDQEPECANIRL